MVDWQAGITGLDSNYPVKFSFRKGFNTYCDNLQVFKALGIYDQIENDALSGYEKAHLKMWGIPTGNEENGYYKKSERPIITVLSDAKVYNNDINKKVLLKNQGSQNITQELKITTSQNDFSEIKTNISTSMEFNQSTTIEVESESSKFTMSFSIDTARSQTKSFTTETTTNFTIAPNEQLVTYNNPSVITNFNVNVNGKFCLNCDPRFNGHYLWMTYINKNYNCQVIANDVGSSIWSVEKIENDSIVANNIRTTNNLFNLIGKH